MSLTIYKKKRNFLKTSEPRGKRAATKGKSKLLYIIQKHAASHLHYDFRLELNGVLLSWAVPKGPCLDPTVKRLAMHVEDHPLEYGSFEGTIPQGEYGGGTVMLWDKGIWVCEDDNPALAYHKGHLSFSLEAEKLAGKWSLVRINKNDKTWLLIKGKDEYAKPLKKFDILTAEPNSVASGRTMDAIAEKSRKVWGKKGLSKKVKKKSEPKAEKPPIDFPTSPFPQSISPELATLVDKPPVGNNWIHEWKLDGYRLIACKENKKVTLWTRNHNDWTTYFKTVAQEISVLPIAKVVLDGEIVVLDEKKRSDFQLLQNTIKQNGKKPFVYYIFDLLYLDKYDLTKLPLIERKKLLKQIIPKRNKILRYSEHYTNADIFKQACKMGLEGIVSKNVNSHYLQKRTMDWLKIKCSKRQEFIIVGFTQPQGARSFFGSLLLATYNEAHELIYHGNVGTGFTQASLESVNEVLSKIKTEKMPFKKRPPGCGKVTWVKPIVVAEIEFSEWTKEGSLRHPSFKGLRKDKSAKVIKREEMMPIKKIAKKKVKSSASDFAITHPEKILYPEDHISKQELVDYYQDVKDWILPYIASRPLTLVRCPEGYQKCFFQKHLADNAHPDLFGIKIKEKNKTEKCIYLKDANGLLSLAQMGTLEIHTWGSTISAVETPDIIVIDLDPAPDVKWERVVDAAFEVKQHLADFKLRSFVKTTGGHGLHVVIPIQPEYDWDEIKNFTHVFTDFMVMQKPKDYIGTMSKLKRKGKIFIDYLRNQRGATAIAPYSTRSRTHAPIAVPVHWDELTKDRRDTFFTLKTVPQRLLSLKDPWKDFFKIKQSLRLDKIKNK